EGGNPVNKEDWSRPERIVRMDGSQLCEEGKEITLDMTCFEWEGDHYVIWSQRQFLPKDLGAWLYIAKLNPQKPWMLASEPVVLSKPDYGWGNNHTFVEEGPFALVNGDTLYITFSAAAVDVSYVVSYLSIKKGQNLLNPAEWIKNNYPILTARSVKGEYGTGHNAYVIDESGTVWNTYHARFGVDAPRSSAIRRVHFDIDGAPMLDVTEELDIKDSLKDIQIIVEVSNM
ncbi:MAG: family 43 glycosylhydrolase, partial [Lachnospiraceae bacterium]|nr:family 43 glycosylhydrolase [Lachnospiraceae bacterium]